VPYFKRLINNTKGIKRREANVGKGKKLWVLFSVLNRTARK